MSNISDKDIDKLFQEAGSRANYTFDQEAWAKLDRKLDAPGTDGLGFYKSIGSVLLGIIVLTASIFILTNRSEITHEKTYAQNVIENPTDQHSEEKLASDFKHDNKPTAQSLATISKQSDRRYNGSKLTQNFISSDEIKVSDNNQYNNPDYVEKINPETQYHQPSKMSIPYIEDLSETEKENTRVSKMAVKLLLAPDYSSLGFYSPDRAGFNIGLQLEYHFANRWWLSTGAFLSEKNYADNNSNSDYGFYNETRLDNGSCRVIDIPINAGFYLIKNEKSNFYITAGLSSYIMLSESYTFTRVDYYGTKEEWSQTYKNENNHLFGLINFGFGYEYKLSQRTSLQAEPFIKSPITDIGAGKVNLVSGGLMFNIKYQFNQNHR